MEQGSPPVFPVPAPMSGLPSSVTVYEVGPRDGLQAESTVLPTAVKAELVERLVAAGLRAVEATSFVPARWVPQLADGEDLMATLTRRPGVRLPVLVPNERGYDRAVSAGADEVAVLASATQRFAQENLGTSVEGALDVAGRVLARAAADGVPARGYVSMAFGDPWEGVVAPERVAQVAADLVELGCRTVSLGDTIGVATAGQVSLLLDAAERAGVTRATIALHFHDTYGQALANVLAGLHAGVAEFDSSAGGLGGCPYARSATGNLATEDLVWLLTGLGIDTGVDLLALVRTSAWLAGHLGHPAPSRVATALGGSHDTSR